jgi:hypothetical protein
MMRVLGRKKWGEGNEVASYAPVLKALSALKRSSRLDGTVFIHEGIILGTDTDLSDKQNSDFVREINALVSQYRNGGRSLSRALFGFDAGAVLIFHTAPFVLCLLFHRLEDAAEVEKSGEKFLQTWSKALKIKQPDEIVLPLFDLQKALAGSAAPVAAEDSIAGQSPEAPEVVAVVAEVLDPVDALEESTLKESAAAEVIETSKTPDPVEPVMLTQTELPLAMDIDLPGEDAEAKISDESKEEPTDIIGGELAGETIHEIEDLTEVEKEPTSDAGAVSEIEVDPKLTESEPVGAEEAPSTEAEAEAVALEVEAASPREVIVSALYESNPVVDSTTPESATTESKTAELSETPIPDQLMNLSTSDPGETWNSFRQKIENLLSKVLGRAQAVRLIERELDAIGIESGTYLLAPQFRPFGQKLMQKVKDKALRNQLEMELIALIEAHQK